MRAFGVFLLIFGIIIIYNPDIIAYLLGGLLVFIGLNLVLLGVFTKKKNSEDNYVKFGNYKIFR
ncbi:MAG: hypothetical protein PHH98_04870 [Candidatus Gracilibacteria bacterium]|nr:hypothetical protein [Candidatus Gracilibacteria bacterium]